MDARDLWFRLCPYGPATIVLPVVGACARRLPLFGATRHPATGRRELQVAPTPSGVRVALAADGLTRRAGGGILAGLVSFDIRPQGLGVRLSLGHGSSHPLQMTFELSLASGRSRTC